VCLIGSEQRAALRLLPKLQPGQGREEVSGVNEYLNKYYFQELCPHLQAELVTQALEIAGHYQYNLPASQQLLEDIDDFINRHNFLQTIPEWFETVESYEPWTRDRREAGL
jgi:hypothetical protein